MPATIRIIQMLLRITRQMSLAPCCCPPWAVASAPPPPGPANCIPPDTGRGNRAFVVCGNVVINPLTPVGNASYRTPDQDPTSYNTSHTGVTPVGRYAMPITLRTTGFG